MPPAKPSPVSASETSDLPRTIGVVLSLLLGGLMVVIGVASWGKTQALLTLVHFVVGGLMVLLAWKTHRRSRAAWAFLSALHGVLVVYFIFGAPTFVKVLGVGLPVAMFPAFLFGVATIALVNARRDFVA